MDTVRVRFAPSPTGWLHIGGARTALYNWLFARKHGGKMVIRIEDTDAERSRMDLVQPILDALAWLGIDWDEGPDRDGPYGPYLQSQRRALYQAAVDELLAAGKAYRCFCSPETLAEQRAAAEAAGKPYRYPGVCRHLSADEVERRIAAGEPYVVRLVGPAGGTTVVHDLLRGEVAFDNQEFDDFIIVKSSGIPTYNFACVIDDHAMAISHVIRAEEHLSNTPRQLLIYEAFGYEPPQFAHVSMVLAPDRSKLSKRHGAVAVEEFRESGYLPEALVNYIALLGWSPGDDRELLTLQEMVELFDLQRVSRAAAIYDVGKLTWMNGQYLHTLPLERILPEALKRLQAAGFVPETLDDAERARVEAIVDAVRSRVRTLDEIVDGASYFFKDVDRYDPEGVKKRFLKEGVADLLREAREVLASVEPFTVESTEQAYRELVEKRGISGGALFHPTRLALTGRTMGPSLFEVIALLGRETCLKRLADAIAFIESGQAAAYVAEQA